MVIRDANVMSNLCSIHSVRTVPITCKRKRDFKEELYCKFKLIGLVSVKKITS